jgi:uridine phosphorylase
LRTGIVHCKSSLYAREFGDGPRGLKNKSYINLLMRCGVLASEMETAALFIQSQIYNYELSKQGTGPAYRVLCGGILEIISVAPDHLAAPHAVKIKNLIELAIETIGLLALTEDVPS